MPWGEPHFFIKLRNCQQRFVDSFFLCYSTKSAHSIGRMLAELHLFHFIQISRVQCFEVRKISCVCQSETSQALFELPAFNPINCKRTQIPHISGILLELVSEPSANEIMVDSFFMVLAATLRTGKKTLRPFEERRTIMSSQVKRQEMRSAITEKGLSLYCLVSTHLTADAPYLSTSNL